MTREQHGQRWWRLAAVLALLVAAYFLVPVRSGTPGALLGRGLGALLLLVTAGAVSLRQVRRSVTGASARIDGLLVALVGSVVAFSLVAYSLEVHRPGQFAGLDTRLDALYFTLATLLTIGYGDVHAVGQVARALVVVQMLFDVVVIATTASVLTARLREGVQRRRGGMSP